MADPRYRKEPPRILQRNADGFFETPTPNNTTSTSVDAIPSRATQVSRSATTASAGSGTGSSARQRSKSRNRPSPTGSSSNSAYGPSSRSGGSSGQSRRPSEDAYDGDRYRRPSGDAGSNSAYDDRRRPSNDSPSSSTRSSPPMKRDRDRRPSLGTDQPMPPPRQNTAFMRSTSGPNMNTITDPQRSLTAKAASSSSMRSATKDEFASILPARIREGSAGRDKGDPSDRDRVRERQGSERRTDRADPDISRSRTQRDGVPERSVQRQPSDRDRDPPSRLMSSRRTEPEGNPTSAASSGAQSASFDDMLKALEDLHVKTAANPPRSTLMSPMSPANRSSDRLAPADRPASGRTSREYDRMTASLDQLIGNGSSTSSTPTTTTMDRDAERREREKERERARLRDRDRDRNGRDDPRSSERPQDPVRSPDAGELTRERTTTRDAARDREAAREQARERARVQRDGGAKAASATNRSAAGAATDPVATAKDAQEAATDEAADRHDAREVQRKRKEQERIDAERRDADLRENEMIAKARQRETAADRQRESARNHDREARADESIIVPDYVNGLMMTLRSDRDAYPVPDDFYTPDGYAIWEDCIRLSFSEVLCELLKARFIDKRKREKESSSRSQQPSSKDEKPVQLYFKIVEARDLIAKEGRSRSPYCTIEHGNIPDDGTEEARKADKERKEKQVMQTETINNTTNPQWNQHVNITVNSMKDKVMVTVYDKAKEQFLGRVKIAFGEIVPTAARDGALRKWYRLNGVGKKEKDKYVGGEMLIEVAIKDGGSAFGASQSSSSSLSAREPIDPLAALQGALTTTNVDFRSMYKVLLRSCLVLDMNMLGKAINERTEELLSDESASLLLIIGRKWRLSEAFMAMSLLELLFERYKQYEIPQGALLRAYERVKSNLKQPGWLSRDEKPALVNLLSQMDTYYRTQISKYKEFFPKNTPKDALETTIMMLRMICKEAVYREAKSDLQPSFRDEFRSLLTEAAIARYQKLSELSQPLDDSDVEGVIEGVLKLAELVTEEIDLDAKYFRAPFLKELDIVRLTSEQYLKYFVLTLESNTEIISSEVAVTSASRSVFDLYRRVKVMDERYAKMVPGLKRMSLNAGFNVERWFSPFVFRWLNHLSSRTVEWVNNAVKADLFEPVQGAESVERGGGGFSSSVTDLFSAVYQELEFIKGLEWSDPVQSAGFMQGFAKSVSKAIEQYCDAIALGEIKAAPEASGTSWQGLLATATASVGKSVSNGPRDIANESCVKLCNIEYAMTKLDDMYRVMNVQELNRVLRRHRAALADSPPGSRNTSRDNLTPDDVDDTYVKGAFKIQLSYAENLKPCNKNGLANPYIIVRVPDGTVVPIAAEPAATSRLSNTTNTITALSPSGKRSSTGSGSTPAAGPTVLNGIHCELARSRVISDTINPTWDETFEVILPPVTKIEVAVLSKNLLTADEIAGKATVDLSRGTRLRRKLGDHQTHDVYVEMEPQGRVLVRLTMEGADEDVDFWFRRSKERLGRMRDDFVRALTARIIPYPREEIVRVVIKKHEAAPLPAKSFFSSLTNSTQYSNETAAGDSIDTPISDSDADVLLDPLSEYLNKNLATLDVYLSEKMSQEVIRRCWDEIVAVIEHTLIPPLYGPIESTRRVLNTRQASMAAATLRLLKQFFHADGNGVSNRLLESRRFQLVKELVDPATYHADIPRLQQDYERELLKGRDREMILRLVRVKVEKPDPAAPLDASQVEEGRAWIEKQLARRREVVRR